MSGPIPKPTPRCKHRWNLVRAGRTVAEKVCIWCGRRRPSKFPKAIERGEPPKATGRPSPISKKRRAGLAKYAETRRRVHERDVDCVLMKLDHALCWRLQPQNGNDRHERECEHVNGRRGQRLNDERGCVSLHPACHRYVTDHAKEWKPKLREYLARIYG